MTDREYRMHIAEENIGFYEINPQLLENVETSVISQVVPPEMPPRYDTKTVLADTSVVDVMIEEARKPDNMVGVMVFASAKNPGGGWRNGVLAQEEAICYSSLLPFSLEECVHSFYDLSWNDNNRYFYTQLGIYSPNIPIIRDGKYQWLSEPYPTATFYTVVAPNVGAMIQNRRSIDENRITMDLQQKMLNTLSVFAQYTNGRMDTIILGAFGCGVFKNDPNVVAALWHELLETRFKGVFRKVVFAIPNPRSNNFKAFQKYWGRR